MKSEKIHENVIITVTENDFLYILISFLYLLQPSDGVAFRAFIQVFIFYILPYAPTRFGARIYKNIKTVINKNMDGSKLLIYIDIIHIYSVIYYLYIFIYSYIFFNKLHDLCSKTALKLNESTKLTLRRNY